MTVRMIKRKIPKIRKRVRRKKMNLKKRKKKKARKKMNLKRPMIKMVIAIKFYSKFIFFNSKLS